MWTFGIILLSIIIFVIIFFIGFYIAIYTVALMYIYDKTKLINMLEKIYKSKQVERTSH